MKSPTIKRTSYFFDRQRTHRQSEHMFRQFRPFARQALEHSGLFRPAEVRHALARLRKVNTALNCWPIFIGQNVSLAERSPSAQSAIEILLNSAPVLLGVKPVADFSLPPNQISSFRFCAWISQIRAAGLLDMVVKLEPSEGEMKENGNGWRKIHIGDEITLGAINKITEAAEQVSDRYLRQRIANKGIYRAIQKNSPDKIFEAVQKLRRGADGIFYGYPEPAVKGFTKFCQKSEDAQQFRTYSSKWSNYAIIDAAQTPELITRTLNRFDAATELMGLYLFMVHALRFYLTYSMPSVAGLNFECNLYLSPFNHPFTGGEVEMFTPR